MTIAMAGPDPSSGPKNDLIIYLRLVDDLLGKGVVYTEVENALKATEREKYEDAQLCLLRSFWMVQGAANVLENSHRDVEPGTDPAPELVPWRQLEQRAKVCLHWLDKLPEQMRLYKSRLAKE